MNAARKLSSVGLKALLTSLALCLCLVQAASSAGTRISGAASIDGNVIDYEVASTGQYAVYKAYIPGDTDWNGIPSIFSVPLPSGSPIRLTAPLPPGADYDADFVVSPDGSRVAYDAYQDSATYHSLYTIPIGGGTAIRVSKAGENSWNAIFSPDSQWLVFSTTKPDSSEHLYRVPASGPASSAVEMTIQGAADFSVYDFKISPDGERLVFIGRLNAAADWGIYSMPLMGNGSDYVKLSRDFTQQWIVSFEITPDGQYVVYRYIYKDGDFTGAKLYSVPIAGPISEDHNISGTLVAGGKVEGFKLSPNGLRVVFSASKEVADKFELYSARVRQGLIPSFPIKLNVVLPDDKDVYFETLDISPDNSWVAYQANQNNAHDTFIVPLYGPASENIKVNLPISFTMGWTDYLHFTPDSQRLIFTSMQDTAGYRELYSIPVGSQASEAVKLNLPLDIGGDTYVAVYDELISEDSLWVFYTASTVGSKKNLFRVPVEGPASASENLSEITDDGLYPASDRLVPGKQQVIYQQYKSVPDEWELYLTTYSTYTFLPMVVH